MKTIDKLKEIEELCKPVADYLKRNYGPHCSIVISDNQIKLTRQGLGIPVYMKENKKETALYKGIFECGA